MDFLILSILIIFTSYVIWLLLSGSKDGGESSTIAKIDKEMADLNDKSGERIRNNPRMMDAFKIAGIKIEGRYGEDVDSSDDPDDKTLSRAEELFLEYGPEVTKKILNEEVWINMTEEQLIESRGYPSDEEREITEHLEIKTLVYGNKISGSYFVLKNGKVTKITDR